MIARLFLLLALLPATAGSVERITWSGETALGIPTLLPFNELNYSLISTLPQPLVIGASARCEGAEWYCTPGLEGYAHAGYLFYPFSSSERRMRMFSFEVGARMTPWSFPLYGSLGFGIRKTSITADLNTFRFAEDSAATDAELSMLSIYAAPEVGWRFGIGSGWAFSLSCGVQYSLIHSGSLVFRNRNNGRDSNNDPDLATQSSTEIGRIAGLLIFRTGLRFTKEF